MKFLSKIFQIFLMRNAWNLFIVYNYYYLSIQKAKGDIELEKLTRHGEYLRKLTIKSTDKPIQNQNVINIL